MTGTLYTASMVAVMAAVTMLLRVGPFVAFKGRTTPRYIVFLGKYLPCAIMGMLVVYCLRNISFLNAPFGLPEIISAAVVVVLHIWRRNTLLSVIAGTVCYMLLAQFVFVAA